jgi:hypothetical protein
VLLLIFLLVCTLDAVGEWARRHITGAESEGKAGKAPPDPGISST